MSVGNILRLAGAKMGLSPTDSDSRAILVRFLNEAAPELYTQCDMAGSLMEQVFKVNGDQTVTMPTYVGKIRAVREYASMQAWHINQLRPRYNQFNWQDMWRNVRLKNTQALMATVVNHSHGVITVPEVEDPPLVISLSGPTKGSSLINETVTMDATSKITNNQFLDYVAVKKDRISTFDVTLQDVDENILTVIPNNELQAQYQILDISTCPWLPQNVSKQDNYVEILYKKKLPWLSEDDDEFPAFDYDYAVVNKMLQLWAEEQEKVDVASAYDAKASRTTARVHEDQNRETEDMVSLVAHPHDTLLRRVGTGIRRRFGMYGGRKF